MRRGLIASGVAILLLSGCAAPVAPAGDGPGSVCDGGVFADNIAAELDVEATALQDPAYPIGDLLDAGLDVACTAHLEVEYVEAGETVGFDVLVAEDSIDETAAALAGVAVGWVKDEGATIWRAPDDPTRYVQAAEIPQGVLVGATAAG